MASRLVEAKVLHAEESYSLDDDYGLFAANIDNGEIVLAANIVEAGEWTVVLRATSADGSVTATQRVAILALPPQDGNPYNDGYFGEGGKGEGTAENPFRIYNIEQLQAIDGVVPGEVAVDLSSVEIAQALTLFGANAEERLSLHYVLANDIDATATRGWNGGKGFDPIDDFRGVFDGGKREVRGVWIDRPDEDHIGLFGSISGAIVSLGVSDAHIRGRNLVGGMVGDFDGGTISSSDFSGVVSGNDYVGGLVGYVYSGSISSSWSSGAVSGLDYCVGGLVGEFRGDISSSWSSSAVSGRVYVGGLVGFKLAKGTVSSSWSSGVVSGERKVGGLVGRGESRVFDSYWSVETSGARYSEGGGIGVDTLQTLSVAAWDADAWRFGGDRDFPVLVSHDADLQAAEIASGLTRVLNVYDGLALDARATTEIYALIEEGATSGIAVLQLDTNGLAANEGEIGETSKPVCDFRDGVLSAAVGYNGVTVRVRSENAALSELRSDCRFVLHSLPVPSEAALSVDIVADAITLRRVYNFSVAGGVRNDTPTVVNSGTTIFIAADAAAGSAAATVMAIAVDERVSAAFAYAAQSPYFTVSERGAGAIWLADSAIDIFGDENHKELTLIVTVSNEQAPTLLATATFYFRSAPRAIDGGALTVTIEDFRRGAIALPSRLVEASILHGEESYSLGDGYGLFAANPDDGAISLTADISVSGAWTVALQAEPEDGSIAAVQTIVFRTPPPLGGDNPFDDGHENGKGEGTPENPFRIYNIEQLQAIDGVVAPDVAISPEEVWKGITLFGANDEERLSRHYILANDIDATATRGWNGGEGFDPIGSYNGHFFYENDSWGDFVEGERRFIGSFNGDGHVVRGLWINRSQSPGQALFAFPSHAQIVSVGVVGARIVARYISGVLVGYNEGATVSRSWAADSSVSGVVGLGGLVGFHRDGLVEESWFSGSIVGDTHSLGGVAGNIWYGDIKNSWSSGSVKGERHLGGFVGYQNDGYIENSWSAAAVAGNVTVGGFVSRANHMASVYWSVETSGQTFGGIDSGSERQMFGVGSLQTISVSGWDSAIWNFGDPELGAGDRAADFPILRSVDSDWQAMGIASGLTRVLNVSGGGLLTLDTLATMTIYALTEDLTSGFAVLQLDTNGLSPNEAGVGDTSKPECSLRDGVLTADTGYNGATVKARASNAALFGLRSDCKFELRPLASGEAGLSVDIIAGVVTVRRAYNFSVLGSVRHAPIIADAGSTIFIAADATAGSRVTTIVADILGPRQDGEVAVYSAQSPYFTVSEKGAGTVWLTDSAVSVFDEDNKELALVVTVSDGRAEPLFATATLLFRSGPRAIDGGGLTVTIGDFRSGAIVLPSRLVAAAIWHAEESYSLDEDYGSVRGKQRRWRDSFGGGDCRGG